MFASRVHRTFTHPQEDTAKMTYAAGFVTHIPEISDHGRENHDESSHLGASVVLSGALVRVVDDAKLARKPVVYFRIFLNSGRSIGKVQIRWCGLPEGKRSFLFG